MWPGYSLDWIRLSTKIYQNMKVCKQSVADMYDTDEFKPQVCAYDEDTEADYEYTDEWLTYSFWDDLINEDSSITALDDVYGSHSYWAFFDEDDDEYLCFRTNFNDDHASWFYTK